MNATMLRPAGVAAVPCRECREQVRTVRNAAGGTVVIDAEKVAGGLYALDRYGTAHRRGLAVMSGELRGAVRVQGGYDAHDCPGRSLY